MSEKTAVMRADKPERGHSAGNGIETRVFLEFVDGVVSYDTIVQNVRNIWSHNMNRNVDKIQKMNVCIRPEEDAVDYCINDQVEGSFFI